MIAFLLAAQLATTPACTTVQPSPAFICQDGGWLPPGHPSIKAPQPTLPPVDPNEPPYGQRFRVGRRYVRGTSDVFIAGTGQLPDGLNVLFAICQQVGDSCFAVGYVRLFPIGLNAADWYDVTPPR